MRSNYLTPEGARFCDPSPRLYESLAAELNFNVMFSAAWAPDAGAQRWFAADNAVAGGGQQAEGVDPDVIGPDEVKRLLPFLDTSGENRYPILGALYHPPVGILRRDAVNWGYTRAADALGVQIHQNTGCSASPCATAMPKALDVVEFFERLGPGALHRIVELGL